MSKNARCIIMLGYHRGDDIHRLEQQNLVTSDSSPKVHRQSIPTTCTNSVPVYTHRLLQKGFISIAHISKVIAVNW